ncbi:MAG TPA: CBS domain-containing protein [Ktedonobacterales bacterium]|nr:CBS domain-containing protein [Ktedonobacterales bacterium]
MMLTARDIMSTQVQTVTAHTSIHDLAQLLSERHISGAPVLSDDGALIGVATGADILRKTGTTVGDIMTASVASVAEDMPVPEIARLLGRLGINRVPVMRGAAVIGIVSQGDIVRAIAYTDHPEAIIGREM